ncbi:MAG TPA: class I SAM-dependent methyltransferase [Acidimicrobiales bacterium]
MSCTGQRYDDIGRSYARHRRPDPRIARQINDALGDADRVVDVGAGTGSYEPSNRRVVAVDPSPVMIAQRSTGAGPVVRGVAEDLPFPAGSFDAALAILSLHHWSDKARGLAQLRRVAKRRVVLCFDAALEHTFWLVRDYLPEIAALDYGPDLSPEQVADALDADRVDVVPVPWDCRDGFLCAYWRRPDAYLDASVRSCISGLARLDPSVARRGIDRLRTDLRTGRWATRHANLLERSDMDLGYRLVIATGG